MTKKTQNKRIGAHLRNVHGKSAIPCSTSAGGIGHQSHITFISKLFPKNSKFPLGQLLLSPGAMECLSDLQIRQALARHAEGNWGEYHEEQWALNDLYLKEGDEALHSAHRTRNHLMLYVSTNASRTLTKVYVGNENREREWNE